MNETAIGEVDQQIRVTKPRCLILRCDGDAEPEAAALYDTLSEIMMTVFDSGRSVRDREQEPG